MIYILDADVTGASQTHAASFLGATVDALEIAGPVRVSAANAATFAGRLTAEDGVIFCNPPRDGTVTTAGAEFLTAAIEASSTVLPVAVDVLDRMPPAPAQQAQSWDLVEFQQLRHHPDDYLQPAVEEFARVALAAVEPTFHTRHPSFFISHRRSDAEDTARDLGAELQRLGHDVFRDLGDVDAGDHAQLVIDARLDEADCLLFLDSPEIGESWYAAYELRTALENRIPVVWVRLDAGETTRAPVAIVPSGAPHIEISDRPDDRGIAALAQSVTETTSRISRTMVAEARSVLTELRDLGRRAGVRVTRVGGRESIYAVEVDRNTVAYPERPLHHVCQLFGRRPRRDDLTAFHDWLDERHLGGTHGPSERRFDAAIMLDPRPRRREVDGWTVRVGGREYVQAMGGSPTGGDEVPLLLISGSWSVPATDDEVRRAVGDVATAWLDCGGGIVFGGHPTFTPVIIGAARAVHPIEPERFVTMYQSEFFVDTDAIESHRLHATVLTTRDEGDRERSLRLMRTRMLEHPGLVAMVVIGGRTDAGGVDEEVDLARRNGIRVIPLATPGGRAAELAEEISGSFGGWSAFTIPPISGAELERLSRRTDYRGIARDLYSALS